MGVNKATRCLPVTHEAPRSYFNHVTSHMLGGHTGDFCYNRLDVAKGSAVAKLSKKGRILFIITQASRMHRLPVSIRLKVILKTNC